MILLLLIWISTTGLSCSCRAGMEHFLRIFALLPPVLYTMSGIVFRWIWLKWVFYCDLQEREREIGLLTSLEPAENMALPVALASVIWFFTYRGGPWSVRCCLPLTTGLGLPPSHCSLGSNPDPPVLMQLPPTVNHRGASVSPAAFWLLWVDSPGRSDSPHMLVDTTWLRAQRLAREDEQLEPPQTRVIDRRKTSQW